MISEWSRPCLKSYPEESSILLIDNTPLIPEKHCDAARQPGREISPGAVRREEPGGPPVREASAPPPGPGGSRPAAGQGGIARQAHLDRIETFKGKSIEPEFSKCPHPVGFFWRVVDGQTYMIPTPCNRYDCPICGKVKMNKVRDKITAGALQIRDDETVPRSWRMIRMLTLTQHPDDPTPIMEAYNRFRMALREKGYRNIRYFWVKEFTEIGTPHLHILVNRFIPQNIIASSWKQATHGWSFIVHIRRSNFTIARPAGYMTKYLGKALGETRFRKHEHRYGHDHGTNWKPVTTWSPVLPGEEKWKFEYCPIPMMVSEAPEGNIKAGSDPPPICHTLISPGKPSWCG